MTEAQTILRMIEAVDPGDTERLDEIDARVTVYSRGWDVGEYVSHELAGPYQEEPRGTIYVQTSKGDLLTMKKYTRSRDALKAIRPEGWFPGHLFCEPEKGVKFSLYHWMKHSSGPMCWDMGKHSGGLPTETLAELHAIIQSIEYERNKQ